MRYHVHRLDGAVELLRNLGAERGVLELAAVVVQAVEEIYNVVTVGVVRAVMKIQPRCPAHKKTLRACEATGVWKGQSLGQPLRNRS